MADAADDSIEFAQEVVVKTIGAAAAADADAPAEKKSEQLAKQERAGFGSAFKTKEELKLHGMEQDIRERKKYALFLFLLIVSWTACLWTFLFLLGWDRLEMPESITLALIGGTTANYLGLFIIVAKYLFPSTKALPKDEH